MEDEDDGFGEADPRSLGGGRHDLRSAHRFLGGSGPEASRLRGRGETTGTRRTDQSWSLIPLVLDGSRSSLHCRGAEQERKGGRGVETGGSWSCFSCSTAERGYGRSKRRSRGRRGRSKGGGCFCGRGGISMHYNNGTCYLPG